MTKPTDVPSSTSNGATPNSGSLPIRSAANTPATTTSNASNNRANGSRPLPQPPQGARPLPQAPQGARPLPQAPQGARPLPQAPQGARPLPQAPQGARPLPQAPQGARPLPQAPQGARPQPAVATQPHPTASANNGNLRVFRDPPGKVWTQFHSVPLVKEFQQLPESHPLFIAVSHCIDTALRALEHPKGRHGLTEGGKRFAKLMKSKGTPAAYKGDPDSDKAMGEWVDGFLKCVRQDFPNVFVTATLIQNAALVRLDRPANAEKAFKPKLAGIMCVDKWILDNMLRQANKIFTTKDQKEKDSAQRNLQLSLFYMTVIILHELMHLFIWYTSGDTRPATPPQMALFPSPNNKNGESGEWLERQWLGAYLKFKKDPNDPLKDIQTGIPFAITGQGEEVRQVDFQFIVSILDPRARPDFTKVFTQDSTSRPLNLTDVNKSYRSMSRVKEEQDRKAYELHEKSAPPEAKFQPVILSGDIEFLETLPASELKRGTAPLDPKRLVKSSN